VDQFNLAVLADPAVLPDAWRLVHHFQSSLAALESASAGGAD
jgi:hypothetical protein